jgi:hypothetical protein
MIRGAASKVMWVGRATIFMVGLSVVLALLFGVASMAFADNGQPFLLGRLTNTATALTKLTSNVNGAAMQVVNTNAGTDDTALDLSVQSGEAPMKVNSNKKVTNLNADRIDDREASSFANATHAHAGEAITSGTVADARIAETVARDSEVMPKVLASDGAGSTLDADKLDGKDSSAFVGVATATNSWRSDRCDVGFVIECAPIEVTVPPGKEYFVTVWFDINMKGGPANETVSYCSAVHTGVGNPCVSGNGVSNEFTLWAGGQNPASSSGVSGPLSAGTYKVSTFINAPSGAAADDENSITQTTVLVRDKSSGLPVGFSFK